MITLKLNITNEELDEMLLMANHDHGGKFSEPLTMYGRGKLIPSEVEELRKCLQSNMNEMKPYLLETIEDRNKEENFLKDFSEDTSS